MLSLLLTGASVFSGSALATVPDLYGMGASTTARGGAGTALADDPYAAYYNPAGLAAFPHITLKVDAVVSLATLQPFEGIVYDTDGDGLLVTADGGPDYGDVGTDYRYRTELDKEAAFTTSGVQIGVAFPIGRRCGLGLAAYMPQEFLMRVEIQDPAIPYYVMFRNRNNRFTLNPALAIEVPYLHDVFFGVGAQLMTDAVANIQLASTVDAELFSDREGSGGEEDVGVDASVQANVENLSLSLTSDWTPNFGLLMSLGALVDPDDPRYAQLKRFSLGITYRGSWKVETLADVTAATNGQIRFDDETVFLSALLEEPLTLELRDVVGFYNPAQLSFGVAAGAGPIDASADVTWANWSEFQEMVSLYQQVAIDALAGTSVEVNIGQDLPSPDFKDTWTTRAGAEVRLGQWHFEASPGLQRTFQRMKVVGRAGAGYVPSPVPDQTGRTNYIDSDRVVLTAGAGAEVGGIRRVAQGPVRLDVAFQYHQLRERTMRKADDVASDTDGDGQADYPYGYPLSGRVTSAGSAWALTAGLEMKFADPRKRTYRPRKRAGSPEGAQP